MQHAGTCRVIGRNEEGILATLGLVERRIDDHVGLVFGEADRLQLCSNLSFLEVASDQESDRRCKSGQGKTHSASRSNNWHNNRSKGAASNSATSGTTISHDEVTIGRTVGGGEGRIEVCRGCIEARVAGNGTVGGHTLIVVVAEATAGLESASVACFNYSAGSWSCIAATRFGALHAKPLFAQILETGGSGCTNYRAVGISLTSIAVRVCVAHASGIGRRAGPVGALIDLRLTRAVGVVLTGGAKRVRLHVGTNATTASVIAGIDSAGVVIVTVRVI